MKLLVDTSVWSLALRRSPPANAPEVRILKSCLDRGDLVVTTGPILQELLQGFRGPSARRRIIRDFSLLPVIAPDVDDHVEAAELRNRCRRRGVQAGTIDRAPAPSSAARPSGHHGPGMQKAPQGHCSLRRLFPSERETGLEPATLSLGS